MQTEKIFALDIGTRSVVGIILEETDGSYCVTDIVVKEHSERAMMDGQIHDIVAVADIISQVRDELEIKHGSLKKVCVAAAGRALKTERAKAVIPIGGNPMLNKEDVLYLELSAVQQAQAAAAEKQQTDHHHTYYCVGYSVLYYKLDGEEIGNLIDQQGEEASVEIIATFLPKVVVDSLIAALTRAGLELDALTLEPIAAINVLVPASMRRLNVALVDIGAGTSDIAITDSGTVIAYGMVPIAGDEVTEAVSDQLLLDFPQAEQAKRDLWTNETIAVQDILGFQTEISKDEAIAMISPAIDRLAEAIAEEIKELNNGASPKAVMLVGGGSMTPELPKRIAEKLGLPDNRAAIRGADAIQGLTIAGHIPNGPEFITPIGIAISARKSPVHYLTVTVNERTVRLFEAKQMTVGDCILASGITFKSLHGKPGMAKIVTLDGRRITIPGTHGKPPVVLKNGIVASLEDNITDGDDILVKKGEDGEASSITFGEFIEAVPNMTIILNGKQRDISMKIIRNGQEVCLDDYIEDRDEIASSFPVTLQELLAALDLSHLAESIQPLCIHVNGRETKIQSCTGQILLNGRAAGLAESFQDGDELEVVPRPRLSAKELADDRSMELVQRISVDFNGMPIEMEKKAGSILRGGKALSHSDVIHDGDHIEFKSSPTEPFIFQDVFNYADVDLPASPAGRFTLLRNEEECTFFEPVFAGDKLQLVWSKESHKK